MWIIVHTCVGLAIAAVVDRPFWQVALLVIASHVVLDLVPHWDYTVSAHALRWGWLDCFGSLAVLLAVLAAGYPWSVVLMGPISAAPDVDVLFFLLGDGRGRTWFPSHWDAFPHGRCGRTPGIVLQAAVVAASLGVVAAAGP